LTPRGIPQIELVLRRLKSPRRANSRGANRGDQIGKRLLSFSGRNLPVRGCTGWRWVPGSPFGNDFRDKSYVSA
jgi:hypothetical protein